MKICSMGAPNVREGESVDIEIDSGAAVSCLLVNIGADTYTLHETRLSMCRGHHVAAGGGKLHELGVRILGLEAANVRGDVLSLLDAIQSHEHWQSTLCRHKILPVVVGRRSSLLALEMHNLSGKLRTLASAREETVCLLSESQAQASQRVAVQLKVKSFWR